MLNILRKSDYILTMNADELQICYERALSRMNDLGISVYLNESMNMYFPVIIEKLRDKRPDDSAYYIVDYSKMLNDKDNKEHLIKDLIKFVEHGYISQFLIDVDRLKFLKTYSKYMRRISVNTFDTILDNSIVAMKQLKLDLDLAKLVNIANNINN